MTKADRPQATPAGESAVNSASKLSPRAAAARARASLRWYVYLIGCRNGSVYTGIALDVSARYAQHVAGTGARYTRANPPRKLLASFACRDQSDAARMEAGIKKLPSSVKRSLVGKTRESVRRLLQSGARG